MENKLTLDISLDVCILFLDADTVDCLQRIYHVCCLPAGCTYGGVLSVSGVHALL